MESGRCRPISQSLQELAVHRRTRLRPTRHTRSLRGRRGEVVLPTSQTCRSHGRGSLDGTRSGIPERRRQRLTRRLVEIMLRTRVSSFGFSLWIRGWVSGKRVGGCRLLRQRPASACSDSECSWPTMCQAFVARPSLFVDRNEHNTAPRPGDYASSISARAQIRLCERATRPLADTFGRDPWCIGPMARTKVLGALLLRNHQ